MVNLEYKLIQKIGDHITKFKTIAGVVTLNNTPYRYNLTYQALEEE
jgi:hypothetical protein